jgi:hypothetical protein
MKPKVVLVLFGLVSLLFNANSVVVAQRSNLATPDTVVRRFPNGRVSVTETRNEEGLRVQRLYSLDGTQVYTFEDSRMHVISSTTLYYHPNGAVERAVTSSHPDGGIQRGETITYFDTVNRPIRRVHSHYERGYATPTLPGTGEVIEYYNQRGQWVRQEVMECNPPLPEYQPQYGPR